MAGPAYHLKPAEIRKLFIAAPNFRDRCILNALYQSMANGTAFTNALSAGVIKAYGNECTSILRMTRTWKVS